MEANEASTQKAAAAEQSRGESGYLRSLPTHNFVAKYSKFDGADARERPIHWSRNLEMKQACIWAQIDSI